MKATYKPGTQLTVGSHRVTIEKWLSEGGFAHVYVARCSPPGPSGDLVCLKRVAVPTKALLNLLRAEVDAMQRLKGAQNIVQYIDSHAERNKDPSQQGYEVFVLMEFCSGGGLIDFMNTRLRDQLREHEVLKIMHDITLGLAAMHSLRPALIHRDLKIENVLLTGNGDYKLCDFGSASPALRPPKTPAELAILDDDIQHHTTAQYRSPEMLDLYRGFPIDEKSDIWALGVFLYKVCYYTTPFEQEGVPAILTASYLIPTKPEYSMRLKNMIRVLLQPNPTQRPTVYQVMSELCSMIGIPNPLDSRPAVPPHDTEAQPLPVESSRRSSSSRSERQSGEYERQSGEYDRSDYSRSPTRSYKSPAITPEFRPQGSAPAVQTPVQGTPVQAVQAPKPALKAPQAVPQGVPQAPQGVPQVPHGAPQFAPSTPDDRLDVPHNHEYLSPSPLNSPGASPSPMASPLDMSFESKYPPVDIPLDLKKPKPSLEGRPKAAVPAQQVPQPGPRPYPSVPSQVPSQVPSGVPTSPVVPKPKPQVQKPSQEFDFERKDRYEYAPAKPQLPKPQAAPVAPRAAVQAPPAGSTPPHNEDGLARARAIQERARAQVEAALEAPERTKLKKILGGLEQRSSTIVLQNESHPDSSLDFLRTLNTPKPEERRPSGGHHRPRSSWLHRSNSHRRSRDVERGGGDSDSEPELPRITKPLEEVTTPDARSPEPNSHTSSPSHHSLRNFKPTNSLQQRVHELVAGSNVQSPRKAKGYGKYTDLDDEEPLGHSHSTPSLVEMPKKPMVPKRPKPILHAATGPQNSPQPS